MTYIRSENVTGVYSRVETVPTTESIGTRVNDHVGRFNRQSNVCPALPRLWHQNVNVTISTVERRLGFVLNLGKPSGKRSNSRALLVPVKRERPFGNYRKSLADETQNRRRQYGNICTVRYNADNSPCFRAKCFLRFWTKRSNGNRKINCPRISRTIYI